MVEGYDIHDIAPGIKEENYNVNTLIKDWNDLNQRTNYDLNGQLDDEAGYDLIFVDYYTMDPIPGNAENLEEIINWVNAKKVLNAVGQLEQNVVMGISMGGLVSRYCLASMTKRSQPTQTRLLLTQDSPHQGANIPIGLQHFLYDLGEMTILGSKFKESSEKLKQFYLLNQQAATENQLIVRVLDGHGNYSFNSFLAPNGPYRQMVDFISTGPQPAYIFKAISQGSQCGVRVAVAGSNFINYEDDIAKLRLFMGIFMSTKYKLKAIINALPEIGSSNIVAHTKMQRNIRFFYGVIGTGWITTFNNSRPSPAGIIPWDVVPGSTQSLSNRNGGIGADISIPNPSISQNTVVGLFLRSYAYVFFNVNINFNVPYQQDLITFVPITSSLDVENANINSFNRSYIFPIDGQAGSRSVKYIAQEKFSSTNSGQPINFYNINHTAFTKRNAEWIFNEMENKPNNLGCTQIDDCYSPNAQLNIEQTGCNKATVTSNISNATSYAWSVGGDLLINGTLTSIVTSTNSINVTGTNGTAQVVVTTPCGTIDATIGYSPFQRIIQGNLYDYFPNEHLSFSVNTTPSDTYYKWYINGLLVLEGQGEYYFCTCSNGIDNSHIGSNIVKVVIETTCNSSEVEAEYIRHASYGRPAPPNIDMYPNPTKDRTTIKLKEVNKKDTSTQLTSITAITVLDKFGNIRKHYKYPANSKNVSLNVTNLPFDIYIVEVSDGKNKVRLQLRVE